MIPARRFNRCIRILTPTNVKNSFNETVTEWVQGGKVYAEVQQPSGNERYTAQQFIATIDAVFVIRWRPNLDAKSRILYDGREYDIKAVLEVSYRDALSINAQARGDQSNL